MYYSFYKLLGRIKRKSDIKLAQNVKIHIILHMREVSSGNLLSKKKNSLQYPMILFSDSEGYDQTLRMHTIVSVYTRGTLSHDDAQM